MYITQMMFATGVVSFDMQNEPIYIRQVQSMVYLRMFKLTSRGEGFSPHRNNSYPNKKACV